VDVAGLILNSILNNPTDSKEIWASLKMQYFGTSYNEIFIAINKYYNKYNDLPSFTALEIVTREDSLSKKVKALSLLEVDDEIDINVAVEALIDQFTQEEVLDELSDYVGILPQLSSSEAILKLNEISLKLDELIAHSEEIYLMNDLFLMDKEELNSRIPLSLNNAHDALSGGMELTHLVMIGGKRGAGKSVVACNIATNQYQNGDVCLFFTIEMRAKEINRRLFSILSGVPENHIKNQICNAEELDSIAKVRADFFVDSEEVYQEYLEHRDYNKFEVDLVQAKDLKPDNQIIQVDNSALTLSDIDLNIQKFKSKHGDKLKTVVVDYVNQIQVQDMYDWKQQIMLSKKLKDFAAKYGVLMVTPYQINDSGEARFSKGILDSADLSIILRNKGEYLEFESTKTRGMPAFNYNSPVEWPCLQISPDDYIIPAEDGEEPAETTRDLH